MLLSMPLQSVNNTSLQDVVPEEEVNQRADKPKIDSTSTGSLARISAALAASDTWSASSRDIVDFPGHIQIAQVGPHQQPIAIYVYSPVAQGPMLLSGANKSSSLLGLYGCATHLLLWTTD